jgi:hypothetical protein
VNRQSQSSLLAEGLSLFVGNWISQSLLYGVIFLTTLAIVLFADIGLQVSESLLVHLTVASALASLILVPLTFALFRYILSFSRVRQSSSYSPSQSRGREPKKVAGPFGGGWHGRITEEIDFQVREYIVEESRVIFRQ